MSLQALEIVLNKRANAEIILPENALPVEKFAAEEFALHVKLISDVELPVVTSSNSAEMSIYLGRVADLDLSRVQENAAKIHIAGKRIDIAGVDGAGAALNRSTASGTLYGVYEVLEKQLGVRWLWPGELGTIAPKRSTITLKEGNWDIKAPLRFANWRQFNRASSWNVEENAKIFHHNESLWLRRQRFSMIFNLNYGHAFTNYLERFGDKHPEFFNMLPDGLRRGDPMHYNARADLISMCVTNQGFIQQVVDDWQNSGAGKIINCNENDTAGKCTCADCLAADENSDEGRLQRARQAFQDGKRNWYQELGSLSDRYAKFYLAVQGKTDKINPDANIIGCIYANYHEAPVKTRLNERIILRFCPPIMFPWNDEKVNKFKDLWGAWAEKGVSLMFRPNFTLDGHNFPLPYYRDFVNCFDFARDNGLIASDMDSLTGMYAANGLTNYIIAAKHGSAMPKSIEELENDYFSAFGAAAPVIRKYYAYLEEVCYNNDFETAQNIEGGRWADFFLNAEHIYSAEVMKNCFALLDKAAQQVSDDKLSSERIAYLRTGLEDAQLVLLTQKSFREYKQNGSAAGFAENYKKLKEFRDSNEHKGYSNIAYSNYLEGRHWPIHFVLLNNDSIDLDNWSIRFDPENKGFTEEWFKNENVTWEAVKTDSHWEKQLPGLKWEQEHGKPFKGAGWYRCSFKVDKFAELEKLKLVFGAVDGSSIIWLNGQKILERPYPYKGDVESWKKPFEVAITDFVKRNAINHLVVRVEKHLGLSGIWRPVFVSTGEKNVEKEQVKNLLSKTWKTNVQSGKFTFQHRDFPLSILCTTAGDHNQFRGVWGRLYQAVSVIPGETYKFQVKFKTAKDFTGTFQAWLRSSSQKGKNQGNINLGSIGTEGESKILNGKIVPDRDKCSVYLNLLSGTGELIIEEVLLYQD